MFLHIRDVKYMKDYKIEVSFTDGRTGVADFSQILTGKAFESLRDPAVFSQVALDPELKTIVWPNGADLAPEFVYYQAFKDEPDLQKQFKQWGYLS